jgi:hypothetical protein
VQLTVTSPPFLDVVQYARDNWLRCWFNSLDAEAIGGRITMAKEVEEWAAAITPIFAELYRVTRPAAGWRSKSARYAAAQSSWRKSSPPRHRRGLLVRGDPHQRAALHQDRQHLGGLEQQARHELESHRSFPENMRATRRCREHAHRLKSPCHGARRKSCGLRTRPGRRAR